MSEKNSVVISPIANSFNKKCPICLEKDNPECPMFALSCFHKIHLKCCDKLNSLDCPLCRAVVTNWPEDIQSNILSNIKKLEEENVQEEHENLVREYTDFVSMISNLSLRPTIQAEAILAMDYLRDSNIPQRYIPNNIEITINSGNPLPESGILFNILVMCVLNRIQQDVDLEDDFSEDENLLTSDEENPFLSENENLEEANRKIRVRRI